MIAHIAARVELAVFLRDALATVLLEITIRREIIVILEMAGLRDHVPAVVLRRGRAWDEGELVEVFREPPDLRGGFGLRELHRRAQLGTRLIIERRDGRAQLVEREMYGG